MAADGVRVRVAALADHAAVLRLVRAVPELPQWTATDLAGADGGTGTVQRCLLVAEEAGVVAGFAQVSAVAGEAELEGMVVDAAHRRGGVGRALLAEVVAWAREQGAVVVRLEVRAGNAAATGLYRSLGFAAVGLRRGYYRQPVEDAVLMSRSLEPSR